MKKITKKSLLKLGFERQNVSVEESGNKAFHYFTLDIGSLCLISCANDECVDGGYTVGFFDYEDAICIKDLEKLFDLVTILLTCKK